MGFNRTLFNLSFDNFITKRLKHLYEIDKKHIIHS